MFDFNILSQYTEIISDLPKVYYKYLRFLPYLVIPLLITFFLTPIIGYIATKLKVFDYPAEQRRERLKKINKYDNPDRHIHKRRVPLLGGLSVIIPFLIFLSLYLGNNFEQAPILLPLLIASLFLVINGVLDDVFNMPATIQLLFQSVAAFVMAFSILNLTVIKVPFDGYMNLHWYDFSLQALGLPWSFIFPGDIVLIFWFLICINAIKWVGGSDALLESNVVIALLMIFLVAVRNAEIQTALLAIFLSGSLSGFVFYNFPPAKIFTGSTGKTLYGFLLAVFSVMNSTKIATTIIILLLPLTDFFYVLLKRYLQHKPKNPLDLLRMNGKDHLHHKLLSLGYNSRQVLLIETLATVIVGSLAVLTVGSMKFFLILLLVAVAFMILLVLETLRLKEKKKEKEEESKESPEKRYSY